MQEIELKRLYNHTLLRYYNGCDYLDMHIEECDKYLPTICDLLDRLNKIIAMFPDMTEWEVLNGFNI